MTVVHADAVLFGVSSSTLRALWKCWPLTHLLRRATRSRGIRRNPPSGDLAQRDQDRWRSGAEEGDERVGGDSRAATAFLAAYLMNQMAASANLEARHRRTEIPSRNGRAWSLKQRGDAGSRGGRCERRGCLFFLRWGKAVAGALKGEW
jgi:hypothetical protein